MPFESHTNKCIGRWYFTQKQLDSIQRIFAATDSVSKLKTKPTDEPRAIDVSLFPTGRPGASLRSRRTGSSSSLTDHCQVDKTKCEDVHTLNKQGIDDEL